MQIYNFYKLLLSILVDLCFLYLLLLTLLYNVSYVCQSTVQKYSTFLFSHSYRTNTFVPHCIHLQCLSFTHSHSIFLS